MAREVNSMRFDDSDDESDGQQRAASSQGGGGKGKTPVSQPASQPAAPSQVKDMRSLFTDGDGEAIKFCIYDSELSEEEIQDLKDKIKEHGGTVVSSYRLAVYVLVNPSTEEGAEYMSRHTTPNRRIVSWKFIDESISRHKVVSNFELGLFNKEDRPIIFYLHESLNEAAVEELRGKILLRGGNPNGTPDDAEVAIHDANWKDGKHMMSQFKNIVRAETAAWLESCITRNRFSLEKTPSVGPIHKSSSKPGRKVGAPRNEFTKKDDQFLVAWMATCFGASMAGRAGNRAYQSMVDIPQYKKWSAGHTWQSWRERYKNKKKLLDPLILAYIAEHGTTQPFEGTDEEDDGDLPVLDPKHGPYKKPRPYGQRDARDEADGIEESDGSHHSNESYRPDKEKRKQKAKGKQKGKEKRKAPEKETEKEVEQEEEEQPEQANTSADTSTQARAKKRARIASAAPETIVVKASMSQKAAPASQKPALSQKPSSLSQKPQLSQKPLSAAPQPPPFARPSSSQKPEPTSQKPSSSSQKPLLPRRAARRPTGSSSPPRQSSPDDHSTPPQLQSPTPPAQMPELPRPKPTQSVATTATLLESQGTQDSTISTSTDDEVPEYPLDFELTTTEAQAMVNRQPTVVDQLDGMGLSSSQPQQEDMEEDEDEDEEIEVGGISQYPRTKTQDEELPDEVKEELRQLAEEHDLSFSIIEAQFDLAKSMGLEEALEVTRESVKELVQLQKRKAKPKRS